MQHCSVVVVVGGEGGRGGAIACGDGMRKQMERVRGWDKQAEVEVGTGMWFVNV